MPKIFKQPVFYLVLSIITYIAVFFYLSFYKYTHFLYNLEDLSIFTNTLYNTIHGNWFWFSTHGGYSYLGDHLELILIFLTPFYRLFPTALTLLFFQTLLIGLSAWPLYLIAKKFFSHSPNLTPTLQKLGPLLISLIFLFNPFLHNINLEEFHLAPFLIFFFLWTFYFYLQKNYKLFWLFFILTLVSREDACLTLGALSLIAAWEYRKNLWANKKWWLYPMLISGAWFVIAMAAINFFNPDDNYKYLLLYGNIFDPFNWLIKIFSSKIIFLLLGLLLPFLFFPLLRPKYLFLIIPTFLQIALLDSSGISVIFSTHYQTFFLIPLFLALITALSSYNFKQPKNLWLILLLLLGTQFFISSYLGPLSFLTNHQNYLKNLEDPIANQKIISLIPPLASLSSPYRLLPNLSSRPTAYVNKLAFLGKKHLSTKDFSLPDNTEYLLLDSADMIEYYLHFTNRSQFSSMYWEGAKRLRETIDRLKLYPIFQTDSLILYSQKDILSYYPYSIFSNTSTFPSDFVTQEQTWGNIQFKGYEWDGDEEINLFFINQAQQTDNYFFRFSSFDSQGKKIWSKLYPPAYGLLPTHDWPVNQLIVLNQPLTFPQGSSSLELQLVKIKGDIELGPLNDTRLVIDEEKILGQVELKFQP